MACGWIDELGNGRFVRNLFEAACRYRDLRLFELATRDAEPLRNEQLATADAVDTASAVAEILGLAPPPAASTRSRPTCGPSWGAVRLQ